MKIINAKVKWPSGKIINTEYGQRINVVLISDEGEEIKLWGNPGDQIGQLKKGENVQLLKDEKGKLKLIDNSIDEDPDPVQTHSPASGEMLTQGKKLAECVELMNSLLPQYKNEPELITKLGTSLFIQLNK
jgi:hypothetical protein